METLPTHPGLRILARIIARRLLTDDVGEVDQTPAMDTEPASLSHRQRKKDSIMEAGIGESSGDPLINAYAKEPTQRKG